MGYTDKLSTFTESFSIVKVLPVQADAVVDSIGVVEEASMVRISLNAVIPTMETMQDAI